jgi:hypothetical protein
MTNHALVPADISERYEVHEWRNGLAILTAAHPEEWSDILAVLRGFTLLRTDILKPGGRKSTIADKLDGELLRRGWTEKGFDTRIVVDKIEHVAPTHKVDCYKSRVALEVEWNNKDPFFDRDLNIPPAVRSSRDRRGRHHHPLQRVADDFRPTGPRS